MHILAIDIGGTNASVGVFRDHAAQAATPRHQREDEAALVSEPKIQHARTSAELGADRESVVRRDSSVELVERASSATDRSGGPAWMLDYIERVAAPWVKAYSIRAGGIGFGGPVDFNSQRVICSTHVEGWTDFDLVGAMKQRLGITCTIDRDTMVGALGEGYYGAGRNARPLFYMTISTGIGGGLLTESGLYRGHDSFSCEIGHHTIETDGPECLCGSRGCLERLCAGIWLERDYGKPARELFQNPCFVKNYVKPLAQGLKTAIMLFNPARIVVGGGVSKAGDPLFVPLREELGRQITSWSRATVDVVPAVLGGDTILWGALALAKNNKF